MGRSKLLQLSDLLILKPSQILLGAELLSLRVLFRVGGSCMGSCSERTPTGGSADAVCAVLLPQLQKKRRSLKASMESSLMLMAAWGSSG